MGDGWKISKSIGYPLDCYDYKRSLGAKKSSWTVVWRNLHKQIKSSPLIVHRGDELWRSFGDNFEGRDGGLFFISDERDDNRDQDWVATIYKPTVMRMIFVSEDVICGGASLLREKVRNQLLNVRCRAFCYQLSFQTHWIDDDLGENDNHSHRMTMITCTLYMYALCVDGLSKFLNVFCLHFSWCF